VLAGCVPSLPPHGVLSPQGRERLLHWRDYFPPPKVALEGKANELAGEATKLNAHNYWKWYYLFTA
jgi:hypothetical protein